MNNWDYFITRLICNVSNVVWIDLSCDKIDRFDEFIYEFLKRDHNEFASNQFWKRRSSFKQRCATILPGCNFLPTKPTCCWTARSHTDKSIHRFYFSAFQSYLTTLYLAPLPNHPACIMTRRQGMSQCRWHSLTPIHRLGFLWHWTSTGVL